MIALYRIDDRLVHGQVVLGWGQSLHVGFIVLVDDEVARSEWEQELYRMGVPPSIEILFASVEDAARLHPSWVSDPRTGIVLTDDIGTMTRFVDASRGIDRVNVGGIHHRAGRQQKLRYVYLNDAEESQLRELANRGVEVTAQDVPTASPVPLTDILQGESAR